MIFKAHPWHGFLIGKNLGLLKVGRSQKFSNNCPALYGLVPQTYCAEKSGRTDLVSDNDPLNIRVLAEITITHGDIIILAVPIGGFKMIDEGETDDKIIALIQSNGVYVQWQDISNCPESLISSLIHHFLT